VATSISSAQAACDVKGDLNSPLSEENTDTSSSEVLDTKNQPSSENRVESADDTKTDIPKSII
jgi:predicted small lipoprotein YifL